MEPTIQGVRHGVYPFCGPCTDETLASYAKDTQIVNGFGTALLGWSRRCDRCGSVVKREFICLLFMPVWPLGRYRIIPVDNALMSSRYVGRRLPRRGRSATPWLPEAVGHGEPGGREEGVAPAAPSRLADHPELRGDLFEEAEDYWEFDRPDLALPVYERVLAAHEAVLPADDIAVLQLRQRVAEAYLTAGRPVAALALLQQTFAHLGRVRGPHHPDVHRALTDLVNARGLLANSDEAQVFSEELDEVEGALGPDHPAALRLSCALGVAQLTRPGPQEAFETLTETLTRSERALGADHPDTGYVRQELIQACELVEYRSKPHEVRWALQTREFLHGPDAPETLAAMYGLAQMYASKRGRGNRREATELLQDALARCERALAPDDPLTADVRRRLSELG